MEWEELPYYVKKRKTRMKHYEKNTRINLDEIALVFGIDTGNFLHPSTIWRYMTERMVTANRCWQRWRSSSVRRMSAVSNKHWRYCCRDVPIV